MFSLLFFALFYTFHDLKGRKKLFWCQKIDFDQLTVCGAPVPWSKYTTGNRYVNIGFSFYSNKTGVYTMVTYVNMSVTFMFIIIYNAQ